MLFGGMSALLGAGCDTNLDPLFLSLPASMRDAVDATSAPRSATPFESAPVLALDQRGQVRARGRILAPDDFQVFDIGPIAAGQRIEVSVEPLDRGFDPAVAVFDENEACLLINDDRAWRRQLDAYGVTDARWSSGHCYVVVAASPASDTSGDYLLTVSTDADLTIHAPLPQLIYLNFEGASGVRIASNPPEDIPVFSGGLIDESFTAHTDELIDMLVRRVRSDFAPYDVAIISSRESPPPVQPHSTVFLGSRNPRLLGIADNIDVFNSQPVQEAIVYVDTFQVFMGLDPTLEMLADALANVTSHEIGHLLGLQHTRDPAGIMDTSATLRQMLAPQAFRVSPLHPESFVIGRQDASRTLLATVGGDAQLAARIAFAKHMAPIDDPHQPSARLQWEFSTGCRDRALQADMRQDVAGQDD